MNHPQPHARTIVVAAGVIIENGRVLITQRRPGTHLAGAWEFPGGKVEDGEDPRAALRRELAEELGIEVVVGEVVDVTFHRYSAPEKCVLLLFFAATRSASSPAPRAVEVADLRFAAAHELRDDDFPAADVAVLGAVRARLAAAP